MFIYGLKTTPLSLIQMKTFELLLIDYVFNPFSGLVERLTGINYLKLASTFLIFKIITSENYVYWLYTNDHKDMVLLPGICMMLGIRTFLKENEDSYIIYGSFCNFRYLRSEERLLYLFPLLIIGALTVISIVTIGEVQPLSGFLLLLTFGYLAEALLACTPRNKEVQ